MYQLNKKHTLEYNLEKEIRENKQIQENKELLQKKVKQSISIYPNPVSAELSITTTLPLKGIIQINALCGQVLLEQPIYSQYDNINVSNLAKGSYLLSISEDSGKVLRLISIKQ